MVGFQSLQSSNKSIALVSTGNIWAQFHHHGVIYLKPVEAKLSENLKRWLIHWYGGECYRCNFIKESHNPILPNAMSFAPRMVGGYYVSKQNGPIDLFVKYTLLTSALHMFVQFQLLLDLGILARRKPASVSKCFSPVCPSIFSQPSWSGLQRVSNSR